MSLRTLYDEASLWMTPGGYEDGKLFSELPTDGSGDFTFSRGSNLAATRVGPTGLIEKGRENLLTQSNTFSSTDWPKNSTSVTSGQIGYDGSSDAWLLERTGASAYLQQYNTSSGVLCYSIYLKKGTYNWAYVRVQGNTIGYDGVYFDLENGTNGSVDNDIIDYSIEAIGTNGWYRCSIVLNDTLSRVFIYPSETNAGVFNAGTGNIYIQDAQLEAGLVATDYIETGASTAQAGILEDMPRLDYSGGATCPALLLEPQRSNILPYSELINTSTYYITNSTQEQFAGTSPDGSNTATKVTSTGYTIFRPFGALTLSTSTTYTFTFYAKNIDASGAWFRVYNASAGSNLVNTTSYFNQLTIGEWVRVEYTFTTTATDTLYYPYLQDGNQGGSILYWGAQLEQGSYPTSYIPTYGSSVTRDKDYPSLTGASGLIGQEQGTIVFDFKRTFKNDNYNRYLIVDDNDSSAYRTGIFILPEPSNDGRLYINVRNNATSVFAHTYNDTTNRDLKIAVSYSSGDIDYFVNGVKVNSSNTTFSFSHTLERIAINGSNQENNQILVFKTKLTDSECIALTTL